MLFAAAAGTGVVLGALGIRWGWNKISDKVDAAEKKIQQKITENVDEAKESICEIKKKFGTVGLIWEGVRWTVVIGTMSFVIYRVRKQFMEKKREDGGEEEKYKKKDMFLDIGAFLIGGALFFAGSAGQVVKHFSQLKSYYLWATSAVDGSKIVANALMPGNRFISIIDDNMEIVDEAIQSLPEDAVQSLTDHRTQCILAYLRTNIREAQAEVLFGKEDVLDEKKYEKAYAFTQQIMRSMYTLEMSKEECAKAGITKGWKRTAGIDLTAKELHIKEGDKEKTIDITTELNLMEQRKKGPVKHKQDDEDEENDDGEDQSSASLGDGKLDSKGPKKTGQSFSDWFMTGLYDHDRAEFYRMTQKSFDYWNKVKDVRFSNLNSDCGCSRRVGKIPNKWLQHFKNCEHFSVSSAHVLPEPYLMAYCVARNVNPSHYPSLRPMIGDKVGKIMVPWEDVSSIRARVTPFALTTLIVPVLILAAAVYYVVKRRHTRRKWYTKECLEEATVVATAPSVSSPSTAPDSEDDEDMVILRTVMGTDEDGNVYEYVEPVRVSGKSLHFGAHDHNDDGPTGPHGDSDDEVVQQSLRDVVVKLKEAGNFESLPCPYKYYGKKCFKSVCPFSHEGTPDVRVVRNMLHDRTYHCSDGKKCKSAKCPFFHKRGMNFPNKNVKKVESVIDTRDGPKKWVKATACTPKLKKLSSKEHKARTEMMHGQVWTEATVPAHDCMFKISPDKEMGDEGASNATIIGGDLYYIEHSLEKLNDYYIQVPVSVSSSSSSSSSSTASSTLETYSLGNATKDKTVGSCQYGRLMKHTMKGALATYAQNKIPKGKGLRWAKGKNHKQTVVPFVFPKKMISPGIMLDADMVSYTNPTDFGICGSPCTDPSGKLVYSIHCWGDPVKNGGLVQGKFYDLKASPKEMAQAASELSTEESTAIFQ